LAARPAVGPYQIRKRHGRANAESKAPEDRRLYRRSETDGAWFACGGFGLRCWMLDVRRWMFARRMPGALVPNEGLVSAAPVLSSARLHDGYCTAFCGSGRPEGRHGEVAP